MLQISGLLWRRWELEGKQTRGTEAAVDGRGEWVIIYTLAMFATVLLSVLGAVARPKPL